MLQIWKYIYSIYILFMSLIIHLLNNIEWYSGAYVQKFYEGGQTSPSKNPGILEIYFPPHHPQPPNDIFTRI